MGSYAGKCGTLESRSAPHLRELDAVFSVTHARARRQSLQRAFRGVVSILSHFFGPPLFLPNTLHLPPLGHPLFLIFPSLSYTKLSEPPGLL
jgi:hypothetical protein